MFFTKYNSHNINLVYIFIFTIIFMNTNIPIIKHFIIHSVNNSNILYLTFL